MTRRAVLSLFTASTLAALAAGSSVAIAAPGSAGFTPALRPAALLSAQRSSTAFEVEYDASGYYGAVKCKGHHVINEANYPGNATEGGRDVEVCKSTTGKPLATLAPGEVGTEFPGSSEWESDYFSFVKGLDVRTTNVSYRVSPNGKTFRLVAVYPFA